MKKVLILGAYGMAGHMISMYFSSLKTYEIINVCHKHKLNDDSILLDVKDISNIKKLIVLKQPDIIINCVGILNRVSDDKVADLIYINSYFPKELEQFLKESKTRIIHLSTDCVFSGKEGGYTENSFTDGTDIYARSKILGEIINDKDLTIRTSIIGPELKKDGIGLFHWFMNQEGEVNGFSSVIWTGITTLELAVAIDKMIEKKVTGLYHLVPKESIDKYNLLKIIKKVFNKDITILKNEIVTSDKSLICTRNDFGYDILDYTSMIYNLRLWMEKYIDIYKNSYIF